MNTGFQNEMNEKKAMVEQYLDRCFTEEAPYKSLLESMRYSLLAGGKRLRPILCLSFAEAVGGMPQDLLPVACAIEMVHTYSLIHDDLPCMDNDDYRRGRLTNHRVFGDATATLAGDALLTAAFSAIAGAGIPAERAIRCVEALAAGAGEHGMVAGQILDLIGETTTLNEKQLREVHRHKTGDLIRAACVMGVIAGGGNDAQLQAAEHYAYSLGMAFQIRDDMLDEIGNAEELGKPIGSDQENGKSTFVSLLGLDGCQKLVQAETEAALSALKPELFSGTEFLTALAESLVNRTH